MSPSSQQGAPAPTCAPVSRFEDLIPIAVVIAAGCETCSENAVASALDNRASQRDIGRVLRIVSEMRKLECFARGAGTDAIGRMERPLAAAQAVLRQATPGPDDSAHPRRDDA